MAKLILSLNGAVQREFTLTKERTTIGRKPDNDIQIDNLAVSGKHALIITILDDSFLEDLGSTNGTYRQRQTHQEARTARRRRDRHRQARTEVRQRACHRA